MEEDVGVKVTRLRRRLSVEQSEDGGDPAPSTPTKKRGGRLAVKPQLDFIDENTPVSSPKKTRRKSLATDAEEKPITPTRRSTRIKSNSSIVSETLSVQATDSPRAKRAARRNSQAGSDNEGPATPVRPTRRTRKDSASSVEQDSGALIKPLPVVEMVIEEEPENEIQKTVNLSKLSPSAADSEELSPNSARKSKRLLEKRNTRSGSYTIDQDSSTLESKNLNISSPNKKTEAKSQESPSSKSVKSKELNDDLSESNLTLLNNIETESKSRQSAHNKSTSALNTVTNNKIKRNRTESWPAVISVENCINISDSKLSKKRKGKSDENTSGFSVNNSPKIDISNTSISVNNTVHSILDTSTERIKKKSETNIEDNLKPLKNINALQVLTSKADNISDKDNVSDKSDNSDVTRDMAKLFENTPENVQATVYFEDSDSNCVGASNINKIEHLDSEDQCVPVVKHDFQENLSRKELGGNDNIVLSNQDNIPSTDLNISKLVSDDVNNSCEPMDIDETIHEEILQKSLDTLQHSNKSLNLSQGSINEGNNNSKRKTSFSNSGVNTPDQSTNNKRKTSTSYLGTPSTDLSKHDKRKSSISNYEVNVPEPLKEENKRKSSVSNSETNSLNYSINDKSKSSIPDSMVNSHQSKNDRRKSSISSSGTDTPEKSKNNTNNKSTLILSQLKDVSSTTENKSPSLSNNEVLSKSDINEKSNQNKVVSKNNLSLNDVKGTPKQNSIQKLTMQTSTPITTQQPGIKKMIEEQAGPKKTNSDFSKSINDDTDCSEASGDEKIERSVEKRNLLDDEAEEASDDYESGDSQDEEDRKYEAEHEIVERGATLTSDDEVSNDTDYEKDSFVVSSDEEDDELLSGSGDDLSMSDKELTMSKKSKRKFNERKLKEQKNASREMFESRHKLNTSDEKLAKPKSKKNRMRIDSSLIASDEEVVVNPKKSNRLDSSLNESTKLEEPNLNKGNINKSKEGSAFDISDKQREENNKTMRDSICDKSATDEREISVFNESNIDNADPLKVLVKQEPKTPQKDLNMSIVQFTDREEIENVQITEGNSIINQTGTDPLQATMACEDEYSSDSSESEEILQNYDSVLNELNKENKTNFNKHNVSLNSGKKIKKSQMEPIIDQLNLTHTKKSKKNKDNMEDASEIKAVEVLKEKQESDSEDCSDSIDLQLLFSEDNCDSDDDQNSQKNKPNDDNMFIPLKKSPGKTNIRGSTIGEVENQSILDKSSLKKKKKISSLTATESQELEDTMNVSKNISVNEGGTGKKNKHSILDPNEEDTQDTVNISKKLNNSLNESGVKKKKKHSISEPAEEKTQVILNISKSVNNSMNESGTKKKKKYSISEPAVQENEGAPVAAEPELNESTKKKKRKTSLPAESEGDLFFIDTTRTLQDNTDTLNISKSVNNSMNESGTKKKKKHSISEPAVQENEETLNVSKNVNVSMNESGTKKKKKHSISEPLEEETRGAPIAAEPDLNESTKKKKKRKTSLPAEPEDIPNISKHVNNSMNESGRKKKKKHSISEPAVQENQETLNVSESVNICMNESGTKKKKKHSISEPPEEETRGATIAAEPELTESSKKKKKRITSLPAETEENTIEATTSDPPITPNSEKKKNNQKLEALVPDDDSDGAPDEAPYQSEKASEMDLQNLESVSESADSAKKKHKKKKKKKSSASNQSGENVSTENTIPSNSKKRKRKSSNTENSQVSEDVQVSVETGKHNELGGSNKKRKISHNEDKTTSGSSESKNSKKHKTKIREGHLQKNTSPSETDETQVKKNKKRKHRDDDGDNKQLKVKKDSSFQEVHVPRLPDSILRQLDDKPRKIEPSRVVSTSNFIVENARQKRAKPSNYLEESIYLDEKSPLTKKQKLRIKKPKVLPFIPTASISDSGFTTNFKINKLSHTTTFEAEPVVFSKEKYLQKNDIKRLGTYDRYKKQLHHKMSKF